jgi:hypothetical protein
MLGFELPMASEIIENIEWETERDAGRETSRRDHCELQLILPRFTQAEKHSRFLRYVVDIFLSYIH